MLRLNAGATVDEAAMEEVTIGAMASDIMARPSVVMSS
jgi:hypothetical protein